jgi:RHS repeat-associated protein
MRLAAHADHSNSLFAYRRVISTGVVTTAYGYDINDERVQLGSTIYPFTLYNTQGASSTITKHIFANGQPIADIQGSGATTSVYYLHGDNLNSINVVSNSSANIDQLYAYYPYGAQRVAEKNGAFTEQRQYIGDEYDPASSLNYINTRYLNSSQGQFLSQDSMFLGNPKKQNIIDQQFLNSYSYSDDNPIAKSDPSGNIAGWDDLIASGFGGLVNFDAYTIQTAIAGQPETWAGAGNAFVTGSIMGEGIDNAPETGGTSIEAALATIKAAGTVGARAGFYGNATEQTINILQRNQSGVDWNALALSTAKGALTNVMISSVPDTCLPGLSCGTANLNSMRMGMSTKVSNGTISNVSMQTSFKAASGAQEAALRDTP